MQKSKRKGPSQRQLRVGEQVRHLIAEIIQQGGLHDTRLDGISLIVSEVRMSPDLRHATVFTSELGGKLQPSTAETLNRYGGQIAGRIAKEMKLKFAPKIKFVADESFAEASHIEALIMRERKALERHQTIDNAADPQGDAHDG